MTCNLVSYRAKLLPTTQCFLFFGSGCGKQRQAERRMGNETDAYPHRRTQTTLHTSVKADPNTSRTWVASLRAGLQFRVFQTLEMKRGSDAGSGEEIEPEKEPRVVLSLVQNQTVVRYRSWLLQEHVSRVGRVEQRQSKHLEAAVSLWHP